MTHEQEQNDKKAAISKGISLITEHQHEIGKKGKRIHKESMELAAIRLRVLHGDLCTNCAAFNISFNGKSENGYGRVELRCKNNFSPITIYEGTFYKTEVPSCSGFKPDSPPESS